MEKRIYQSFASQLTVEKTTNGFQFTIHSDIGKKDYNGVFIDLELADVEKLVNYLQELVKSNS